MTEIVYSDSAKGSMRCGQRFSNHTDGAMSIGFICTDGEQPSNEEYDVLLAEARRNHEQEQRAGKALGGQIEDVLVLLFHLDIGDIAVSVTDSSRKKLLEKMLDANQWGELPDMKDSLNLYWNNSAEDLDKLLKRAKVGDSIRIWYSEAPYSICGLYHTLYLLENFDCPISAVALPRFMQIGKQEVKSNVSWGEIRPGEFAHYLPMEVAIIPAVKKTMIMKWKRLMAENSPLRVVLNGRLHRADIDFYDSFISKEMPNGDFKVAQLIGLVLGRNRLGIGDWFIAQRIHKMIESGELAVIRSNTAFYAKEKIFNCAKRRKCVHTLTKRFKG